MTTIGSEIKFMRDGERRKGIISSIDEDGSYSVVIKPKKSKNYPHHKTVYVIHVAKSQIV